MLNAYTLAFGGLLLLGGRLGDVFGRLRMFEIGLSVFTVFSLLGGLAQTPAQLVIAARTLQGVGAAMAAPSVLALLTTSAPDEAARNRALALFGAVSSAGASIGLLLGGVVTDLGSLALDAVRQRPDRRSSCSSSPAASSPRRRGIRGRFDVVGAVTATLGSVAVVHGFISAADRGWPSAATIGSFVVGAAPARPLRAHRGAGQPTRCCRSRWSATAPVVGALVLMALVVGAQFSTFFLVTQYLQLVLGFSPVATGAAFLPLSLAIFATSRVSARLVGQGRPAPDAARRHARARRPASCG